MVGKVNANTTRHLLVCMLWVLRHAEDVPLKNWWSELNPQKLHRLLELLFICVSCFEYQGKRRLHRSSTQRGGRTTDVKTRLEDLILGQGSARSDLIQRRRGIIAKVLLDVLAVPAFLFFRLVLLICSQ